MKTISGEKYESAYDTKSQRQIAEEVSLPRSTLQLWLSRKFPYNLLFLYTNFKY